MVALAVAVLVALLGGWLLAGVLALVNRRPSSQVVTRAAIPLSPDAINMAHIRVEGVGGLGLIAAGVIIAIYLPEIGVSMLAGVGFGAAIAIGLIAYRSHVSASHDDGSDAPPTSLLMLGDRPVVRVRRRPEKDLPRVRFAAGA